jgi:penicillin-binding protein 1A
MAKQKSNSLFNKVIKVTWIAFFSLIVLVVITIFSVRVNLFNLFGELPSYKSMENPEAENDLASILISADGVELGKYYVTNRNQVTFDRLSPHLVNAVLSTEDIRFYEHSGIDPKGLLRALIGKLTFTFKGGGSTITMQLAENIFRTMTENQGSLYKIDALRPFIIKIKEWIISIQLEKFFTKEEIMAMYFNTVFFGHHSYGINTAAATFFSKTPDSLNVQESALLVGMLNAPTRYSPIINPDNALNKRTEVLYNMHKYNFISRETYDSLKILPLDIEYNAQDHLTGPAPYFREVIRPQISAWANENGYNIYEDGLRIYTTIDSRLQEHAEAAMKEHMTALQELFNAHWDGKNPWRYEDGTEVEDFLETQIRKSETYRYLVAKYGRGSDSIDIVLNTPHPMTIFSWEGEIDTLMSPMDSLKYYKNFLQAGFMSMDPRSGQIKAWVGGIDYRYFKYDHVMQGRRQPGSTFKPFVYTAAIDQGYSPCYMVEDAPVTFQLPPGSDPPTYTPQNYNRKFTGEKMTLRQGMARSKNAITAFVMKEMTTPQTVVKYAKELGVENPLDAVPSLCLGVSDVSVYELVGAYSTFVNKGVYTKPYFITRIEDKHGNIISQFPPRTREVLSEETAYLMVHMLMGATTEQGGTALGLSQEVRMDNEIGGKTGTTQNGSDGWFVGLTRNLVSGIWVGGDDRSIHFRTTALGQGARMAMPIWDFYMQKVYADSTLSYEKGPFPTPIRPLSVEIDCAKYQNPELAEMDSVDMEQAIDRLDQGEIY